MMRHHVRAATVGLSVLSLAWAGGFARAGEPQESNRQASEDRNQASRSGGPLTPEQKANVAAIHHALGMAIEGSGLAHAARHGSMTASPSVGNAARGTTAGTTATATPTALPGTTREATATNAPPDATGAATAARRTDTSPDSRTLTDHARKAFMDSDRLFREISRSMTKVNQAQGQTDPVGRYFEAAQEYAQTLRSLSALDAASGRSMNINSETGVGADARGATPSTAPGATGPGASANTVGANAANTQVPNTNQNPILSAAQPRSGDPARATTSVGGVSSFADGPRICLVNHAVCEKINACKLKESTKHLTQSSEIVSVLDRHADEMNAEGRRLIENIAGPLSTSRATPAPAAQPAEAARNQDPNLPRAQVAASSQSLARSAQRIFAALQEMEDSNRNPDDSTAKGQSR